MRAIQITQKDQKVKREKFPREIKSKECSGQKRSSKMFVEKRHTFTIIASNFVREQSNNQDTALKQREKTQCQYIILTDNNK